MSCEMSSIESWSCHIFLFFLFIICQHAILSTNTQIVFPSSGDEEDFLAKFQNKRNSSNGKQKPLYNHQNLSSTPIINNGASSMFTTLSPTSNKNIKSPIRKCYDVEDKF